MDTQQAATPVEAAPEAPSIDDRIASKFGLDAPEAPEAQAEATPAADTSTGEEDVVIPDEVAPQAEDFAWELKHNGETKKLTSKDELTRLAQQGFDYDFKMQRVREDAQRVQSMAQAIQAQAAMKAQALDALAEAKSYERQLKPFANVDWVQLSTADPQQAFQLRMQHDALMQGYSVSMQRAQQLEQPIGQAQQHIDQNQLALEMQKLTERFPEWKDTAKREADGKTIIETVQKTYGFAPQELSGPLLNDHRVVAILRDAWKYREALNAKAKKGPPQGLPQVAKPGAPQPPKSPKQQLGDVKRALNQPNLSRENRKALEDELVARKFGVK